MDGRALKLTHSRLVMMRKIAVLMVASVVTDAYQQTFFALLVTLTALLVQISWHPYEDAVFNRDAGACSHADDQRRVFAC